MNWSEKEYNRRSRRAKDEVEPCDLLRVLEPAEVPEDFAVPARIPDDPEWIPGHLRKNNPGTGAVLPGQNIPADHDYEKVGPQDPLENPNLASVGKVHVRGRESLRITTPARPGAPGGPESRRGGVSSTSRMSSPEEVGDEWEQLTSGKAARRRASRDALPKPSEEQLQEVEQFSAS